MPSQEAFPSFASYSWGGELRPTRRKVPNTSSAHLLAIGRNLPNSFVPATFGFVVVRAKNLLATNCLLGMLIDASQRYLSDQNFSN